MEESNLDLTFNVEKSMKNMILFGLILFCGGLVVSIVMLFVEPKLMLIWWIWLPVIVGYCLFTKMFLDVWKQRNNYVKVNDNAISLHSPENQIELIEWKDIVQIKENNYFERLILKDKSNRIIKLEYELENITELLRILAEKIPHLADQYSKLGKFRRTNQYHIFSLVILIFTLSMTIYCVYAGLHFPAIFLGGFSSYLTYLLLIGFIGVRLSDEMAIVNYPFWKKHIALEQIDDVSIENIRSGNGKSSPFVVLKLIKDKTIKLNAVREGSIALFWAIKTALRKEAS